MSYSSYLFAVGCSLLALLPATHATNATTTSYTPALASQTLLATQLNHNVTGTPLRITGTAYADGLGTHAVSEIPLDVPADAIALSGAVGVDDSALADKKSNPGSVRFRLIAGNSVLWESPVLKAGTPAQPFHVSVPSSHYRKIYLQADDTGDNPHNDHADWVNLRWHHGTPEAPQPARTFDGANFDLQPNAPGDQTPAMNKALDALRRAPGSTLRLAPGDYHFYYDAALRRHLHISNHDQPVWHPVGIALADLRDTTLDAQGSRFIFHGRMLPVMFLDSKNVALRNVSLDFARPHLSQATLTKVERGSFEMTVDTRLYPHKIEKGKLIFQGEGWAFPDGGSGIFFDGNTREIVAGTGDCAYRGAITVLAPGHYRIARTLKPRIKSGDRFTLPHSSRPHPGVLIYRSRDTTLHAVSIHQAAGMGVLGQRSENIRINGGGIFPAPGTDRYFSTNADATHFSNCRGEVVVENARFEGMMDDAINVHATCLRIESTPTSRTIRARYKHHQSIGFEVALAGETLRFIHARQLRPGATAKVKTIRRIDSANVEIEFETDLPAGIGVGDAIENADWFPAVTFRNNTVCNNRARGSLFTTPRPVLVEGNTFDHSSGSAILLAGDANGWYESGACDDVVIRKNIFRDNLTSRYQFTNALISVCPTAPAIGKPEGFFYHRNVRIEDNVFETFDVPLVSAVSTDGVLFRNNTVRYNKNYPGWGKLPFDFRHCANVRIEENTVHDADGKPVNWAK